MMLLKKIGKISTGNTPSKKHREYYNSDDIGFVKPDSISDTVITEINKTSSFISENAREKARIASKGSILITCIGSVGKVGIVTDGEYAFNQQINAIMPNKDVNQKYLAYNLLYNKQRLINIANAPVVPIVNKTQLENFEINFDSNIDTQKKIVEQLDDIALVIDKRKKQLDALDELIKARFLEVFGDPILNPKNWDCMKIGDIVNEVKYGTSLPAVDGGKYPYLRMNNLTSDGYLDLTNLKYIDVSDDELEKCIVRYGDVLFNRTNSIDLVGKTAVYNLHEEMVIAGYIIRIRLNGKILPEVFSQYMNLTVMKEKLRNMAKGAVNQANINAKELQSIKIYIPDMELQRHFIDLKNQTDKSKSVIEKSLKELEILQASLMQKYFS